MTKPLISPVEQAYQRAVATGATMIERLEIVAEAARQHRPEYTRLVDELVIRLDKVKAGLNAPDVGDLLPSFTLPDQDGRLVRLEDLLGTAPLVVTLHRGHWCPYCRLNMMGLAEIERGITPARIVTISTETQRYTRALKELVNAEFPFLSDFGAGFSLQLGLVAWIDKDLAGLIASIGWDVPSYQGGGGWLMPIPAVFVLDRKGIIRARHIDRDYRQRMDTDRLVEILRSID